MPIYVYACPRETCHFHSVPYEQIRSISEADEPLPCPASDDLMFKVPSGASFAFRTSGGNLYGFSPSHGRVTKGNRKPVTITRGNGMGGKRPPPKLVDLGNGQVGVAKR